MDVLTLGSDWYLVQIVRGFAGKAEPKKEDVPVGALSFFLSLSLFSLLPCNLEKVPPTLSLTFSASPVSSHSLHSDWIITRSFYNFTNLPSNFLEEQWSLELMR